MEVRRGGVAPHREVTRKTSVRRRGSVKCILKTKAGPYGVSTLRRKMSNAHKNSSKFPADSELGQLKLRRVSQRTKSGRTLRPAEVSKNVLSDEEVHLHTPSAWEEKFSQRNVAEKPRLSEGHRLPTQKPLLSDRNPKPVLIQKPGLKPPSAININNNDGDRDNKEFGTDSGESDVRLVIEELSARMARRNKRQSAEDSVIDAVAGTDLKKPSAPVVASKSWLSKSSPCKGIVPVSNPDKSFASKEVASEYGNFPVSIAPYEHTVPDDLVEHGHSSGGKPNRDVSPSAPKILALKARFELEWSPEITSTAGGKIVDGSLEKPEKMLCFVDDSTVLSPGDTHVGLPMEEAIAQDHRRYSQESFASSGKDSNRRSDILVYDDVIVCAADDGSSDREGEVCRRGRMHFLAGGDCDAKRPDSGCSPRISTETVIAARSSGTDAFTMLSPRETHVGLPMEEAITQDHRRYSQESFASSGKDSNRRSDILVYDDVIVCGADDGSSDREGEGGGRGRMHFLAGGDCDAKRPDSGCSPRISTETVMAARSSGTDGENPWSDGVDGASFGCRTESQTPRPRLSNHFRGYDSDTRSGSLSKENTPRIHLQEKTIRAITITSHNSGDYDDVDLPQGDKNEWERASESSDMDHPALSGSNMAPGARRSLTECGNDGDEGRSKLRPAAPPRGASLPRTLNQPSRPKEASGASPPPSPCGDCKASLPGVAKVDRKRQQRKASLDATIPPPLLPGHNNINSGDSNWTGSSGHSDCFGGSLVEEHAEFPLAAPPMPPCIHLQAPSEEAPALPPRLPLKRTENSPPPPLPPRDPPVTKLDGNTVVPLSPNSFRPPLPPPRLSVPDTLVPPSSPTGANMPVKAPLAPSVKPRNCTTHAATKKSPISLATVVRGSCLRLPEALNVGTPHTTHQNLPPSPANTIDPRTSVSHKHNESYPQLLESGYLCMERLASAKCGDNSSDSDEIYIDPKDIASQPNQESQIQSNFRDSDCRTENYITILPDKTPGDAWSRPKAESGRLSAPIPAPQLHFVDEPLYQIYHFGAIAREVLDQHKENLNDDDSLYMALSEEAGDVNESDKIYETWVNLTTKPTSEAELRTTLQNVVRTSIGVRTLWSEMPEVKKSGVLSKMTMDERKFQETLFEIITSEASYLKSLKLVITHFMDSFSMDIVSKEDKRVLFSNLLPVHRASERFMAELERWWQNDFMLDPAMCALITKYSKDEFRVYIAYCSNLTYQERKLKSLKDEKHVFREALGRLEKDAMCHGLPLQSFITMPMQRMTRFPLLIDAVSKRLPDGHRDAGIVSTALSTCRQLVSDCNDGAQKLVNLELMSHIDTSLFFTKRFKKIPIVSSGRYPVKTGPVANISKETSAIGIKKRKQDVYLYLFNDILIITKIKGVNNYQVIDHAKRINCHANTVILNQLPPGSTVPCNHIFRLMLLANHEEKLAEFYFLCNSESERLRWVEAVTPVQQVNPDERIYEQWACIQVQTIHRYVATEADELSLEESDVIDVFRKMADGWYEGERVRDRKCGWFPANHTIEIQNDRVRARNLHRKLISQRNSTTSPQT